MLIPGTDADAKGSAGFSPQCVECREGVEWGGCGGVEKEKRCSGGRSWEGRGVRRMGPAGGALRTEVRAPSEITIKWRMKYCWLLSLDALRGEDPHLQFRGGGGVA